MRYGIDRYLKVQSVSAVTWLPDGKNLAYLSNVTGTPQVWRVAAESGFPEQLTYFSDRVNSLAVLPGVEGLFFTSDIGGNEHQQIFWLKEDGSDPFNLTANPQAMHQLGGLAKGEELIYASNARDYGHFDIYSKNIFTGKTCLKLQNDDNYNTPAALSPDGRYLLYVKLRGQEEMALWYLDLQTGLAKPIADGKVAVGYEPKFANSQSFYFFTTLNSDFNYIAHYNLPYNRLSKVYQEDYQLENLSLSPDKRFLAFTANIEGYSELRVLDLHTNELLALPKLPKGVITAPPAWDPGSQRLAILATFQSTPMDVYILDIVKGCFKQLTFSSRCGIKSDGFVAPELHRFNSFDGLSVPTWVYKPHGALKDLPVVISIHGGPESQERPGFNPILQYFINQGIAVVAPNVRGSTGYGRAYQHLDDVEKRMDSVHDIKELVAYLINMGIADPKRIAVMGGSYGGFMTLACITEYPELWAAAVDTVGIANFETFLERTSAYRRVHRETEYGSLAKHREVLRSVSPIHKVDRIVTPLMVIHGANDPRVPIHEAEQIVANLEERGQEVQYLRYEDEGHGIAKLTNRLDCYPKVAAFLKQKLAF